MDWIAMMVGYCIMIATGAIAGTSALLWSIDFVWKRREHFKVLGAMLLFFSVRKQFYLWLKEHPQMDLLLNHPEQYDAQAQQDRERIKKEIAKFRDGIMGPLPQQGENHAPTASDAKSV